MPNYRRKEITATTLVFECLCRADDFLTVRAIADLTGVTTHRIHSSLHALKVYKAVDCIEVSKVLWWFATPDTDTRTRTVEYRAPEDKGRTRRKKNV